MQKMKSKLILYSVFLSIVFVTSCSTPKSVVYQRSGKVMCQKYEEGVIHLVAEANAESTAKAVAYAERNAIENLLFKGVPNSNQEKPIIPNESEAMKKNAAYFQNLFQNTGYQKFVMQSEVAEKTIEGKTYFVKQKVSVDLNAFRSDLEQNKVVRKFGL